jgi:hypothetical protein
MLRPHGAPVDELILTVLSQNTNDRNRDVAYARLRDRFGSWTEVREASVAEIEDTIRPGGLAPTKAFRIREILRSLGDDDLLWLETVPVEEGLARLVRAFLSVGDRYLVLVHEQVRLEPAEVERALAAPTRALLERGQREGRLSQDHPVEWLMEALGGLLRAALRHSAAADLGVEAAAAAVITLFLDGAAAR